ncbi:MAG: SBBP repeat-containing protein, partial [Promethearchaeota archaeon]
MEYITMKTRLIRLMSLILLFSFPFYTISVYLNGNYHLLKNHTTNQCKEDILDTLDISSGTINVLWYAIWGGASYDSGKGVAADTSGNIYCTGATYSYGAGDYDFTLVKYYSNGTKAWNTTWGGSSWEFGSGVAVDTSENIYCSGDTATFGGGMIPNFALVKFYPNGTKAWNTTWGWGGDSSDYCYGVAADTSGNVYCIGETYTSSMGRSYDLALVKFYSNGIKAWNTTWGGTDYDSGRAVAVDTSGNIYCTGETWSYGAGNYD